MGDIFEKEDVSTSVIRRMEEKLNTSFSLISELDYTLSPDYVIVPKKNNDNNVKAGRPITFKPKETDAKDYNLFQKEIISLKEQLRLKDEIIDGKDQLISLLKMQKN